MNVLRFDFWDSLLLCGIIQGIILAAVIITGKKHRPTLASFFLSATLLIFALHNVLIVCRDSQLSKAYPLIENLPFNLIRGFGPCIYFYIFFSLYPSSLKPRLVSHFIPVTIQFVYYLFLTIRGGSHLGYVAWKLVSQTEQISALVSVCIYTFLSWKLLNTYGQHALQTGVKIKLGALNWLSKLLQSYIFLWAAWLVYTLLDIFYFNYSLTLRNYLPLYLLVAGLTYWIGIMAYLHPISSLTDPGNKSFSSMRESDVQQNLRLLQDIMMKEKLYLNPDLNLKQMALKTGVSVNLISFIINNRLNQSFNDWVNSFRIEEVKKQIISSRLKEVTILSIAFECGFNSKATFNRVFKQQTELTPREYLLRVTTNK